MSKNKTGKRKSSGKQSKSPAPAEVAVADSDRPAVDPDLPATTGAPVGQLLFDMPYSGPSPRLINPDLGLHNLVTRAGHNAGYTIDVTLLDAPDHRLIRSGVLLAHRVLDGRGEWYLGAPNWAPLLPEERIEPMGQGDVPQEFADLVRPFRRRATLGPVAALTCERREFALRDDRGTTMALVRDDKVTVRRGGLTTARFREVMLTPTGPGLTSEQAAHLHRQLTGAGGTQTPKFPELVTRLGAPATGMTDFPQLDVLGDQQYFAQFVSTLLGTRLREILEADLAIGAGDPSGAVRLRDRAAQLRLELQGLSAVLDPDWTQDLDEELSWLVGEANRALESVSRADGALDRADGADGALESVGRADGALQRVGGADRTLRRAAGGAERNGQTSPGSTALGALQARLRGERYLTVLERLVTATRSPKAGDSSSVPTRKVLSGLLDANRSRLLKYASRLSLDASPQSWEGAATAIANLVGVCDVAVHVLPKEAEKLRQRLEPTSELLSEALDHWTKAEEIKDRVAEATPEDAFALGRSYEQQLGQVRVAQDAFLTGWAKTAKKLDQ